MNLPAERHTGSNAPTECKRPHLAKHSIMIAGAAVIIAFGAGMGIWGPPQTIVKHEVGPVHTVYVPAKQPVPEKTIEVLQPQSCKDALALAAALSTNAVTMADSSEPLIDAMKQAGVALYSQDKNEMNAAAGKVSKLNANTLKAKQAYAIIYPQFTAKWQLCQKESK